MTSHFIVMHHTKGVLLDVKMLFGRDVGLWSTHQDVPETYTATTAPEKLIAQLLESAPALSRDELEVLAVPHAACTRHALIANGVPQDLLGVRTVGVQGECSATGGQLISPQSVALGAFLVLRCDGSPPVVWFKNGPTGHERYYLKDLQRFLEQSAGEPEAMFPLCFGTPGRWPYCGISRRNLADVLAELHHEATRIPPSRVPDSQANPDSACSAGHNH